MMTMSPVYSCRIHCHTIDPSKLELMGMEEDPGKWMPFCFLMDNIVSCKLASDDEELLVYNCTTLFTSDGDTYIIDTLYEDFEKKFTRYYEQMAGYTPVEASL